MSSVPDYPRGNGAAAPSVFGLPGTFVDDPYLVLRNCPESPLAERYRRLRLRLEQGSVLNPFQPQVTVITSAIPGEGKTTTATNLALAYAEDRKHRALLIGADLRRPSVSRYIDPRPTVGLSEVLTGEVSLDRALIEMRDSKLWVLPSGAPRERSSELLQKKTLGTVMTELRSRFDRIVIDAPPTVPFADAAVLASHADGCLLVVRAGTSTMPLIRRARESLSGTNILGVVLNDVVFTVIDRYYYRYDDDEPGGRAYADKRFGPS
jgi:capsular exopolysaccharide synthesis family protein